MVKYLYKIQNRLSDVKKTLVVLEEDADLPENGSVLSLLDARVPVPRLSFRYPDDLP
jgi:hypothetical protein